MSLFDRPMADIRAYSDNMRARGRVREFSPAAIIPWAAAPPIVLKDDVGLELGKSTAASKSVLMWDAGEGIVNSRITLIGPDFSKLPPSNPPYVQVIMVGGRFRDDYDCYRQLRDAAYGMYLDGVMIRFYPSRQSIWCRIDRAALASGFGAEVMGSALIHHIGRLDFVDQVEVLFITDGEDAVNAVAPAADLALDIVKALTKMGETMSLDCADCEYARVCADVEGLRRYRRKRRPACSG